MNKKNPFPTMGPRDPAHIEVQPKFEKTKSIPLATALVAAMFVIGGVGLLAVTISWQGWEKLLNLLGF